MTRSRRVTGRSPLEAPSRDHQTAPNRSTHATSLRHVSGRRGGGRRRHSRPRRRSGVAARREALHGRNSHGYTSPSPGAGRPAVSTNVRRGETVPQSSEEEHGGGRARRTGEEKEDGVMRATFGVRGVLRRKVTAHNPDKQRPALQASKGGIHCDTVHMSLQPSNSSIPPPQRNRKPPNSCGVTQRRGSGEHWVRLRSLSPRPAKDAPLSSGFARLSAAAG